MQTQSRLPIPLQANHPILAHQDLTLLALLLARALPHVAGDVSIMLSLAAGHLLPVELDAEAILLTYRARRRLGVAKDRHLTHDLVRHHADRYGVVLTPALLPRLQSVK